ncbi:hypothetical protein AVEN_133122-1 [Araneus ventricosus]|uniref:Myb/SANT-like DNA-binding domain-containing protein n=1 Tax=Araneus ventricosus TaxID=182803 RepID=A0A4Y2PL41_ARAVE|nr:hypothetical protein AVEN_133122-1 [Araneus ventricosus]
MKNKSFVRMLTSNKTNLPHANGAAQILGWIGLNCGKGIKCSYAKYFRFNLLSKSRLRVSVKANNLLDFQSVLSVSFLEAFLRMSEKHTIRRRNWTDDEIKILIMSWGDHYNELTCIRRNRRVYDKMAAELAMYGYTRDSSEIQLKIKNFSAQYRREKILKARLASYDVQWKYFEAVGQILNSSLSDPASLSKNSLNKTFNSCSFQDELGNDDSESPEHSEGSSAPSSPEMASLHLNLSTKGNIAIKDIKEEISTISENMSDENKSSHFSSDTQVPNDISKFLKSNKTKEDLFEELINEFKETNRSIKESDLLLRNLLIENNELIKQQNEYILQLLSK